MYWPQIGRFISADSYQGDIANPASLNRYSYVLNNPYKYVDPTGHTVEVSAEGGDKTKTLALVAQIRSTPVGDMVWTQLDRSSHLHVISAFAYKGSATEAIDGLGAVTPGVGSEAMIYLSLTQEPEVPTTEGVKKAPLDVVLLHELVHARHFDKGEAATKPKEEPNSPLEYDSAAEQRATISVENVYREQRNPKQPARTGD